MVCSPEQLASNRRNSARSTGPKTPEGKARSRRNGLKHGLTGAGVVIPDEDGAAVQERIEAFEADLCPRNDVARVLAQRAAFLSVRLERSARQESAQIAVNMLEAEDIEAEARAEELERLIELIQKQPATAVRKLKRIPEGIDWLIASWHVLRVDVAEKHDRSWSSDRAERLCGGLPIGTLVSPFVALSNARRGDFTGLPANAWSELPDMERRQAARHALVALIDAEIAGLQELRETLDLETIAEVRAGARARAIFDSCREAILARKYEAATERAFFRTLKQIEQINSAECEEVVEVLDDDASPTAKAECDDLASSLPERVAEAPQPVAAVADSADELSTMVEPTFDGSKERIARAIERRRQQQRLAS